MSEQDVILLFLSAGTVALLGIFPVFRTWWRGVSMYPFASLLFFILFAGLFFLDSPRPISSELLDPLRMARIIVYILLTGLAWISLLVQKGTARINGGVVLMFVFALVAMLTSAYSVYPSLTLWKSFEVMTHVSVAAVLARNAATVEDAQRILGLSWLALSYLIASLIWGGLLYPNEAFATFLSADTGQAISRELVGIFPSVNPNSVTQIGAIMAVVAISYLIARREMKVRAPMLGLLFVSLIVILLGHSRTSIIGLVLVVAGFAFFSKSRGIKITFFASIVVLIISGTTSETVVQYLLRGQSPQQFVVGLSGRSELWERVLPVFFESPLYGHGYYAAQRVLFGISTPDNSYLTVLLGGGIILLIVFLIPIGTVMWHLFAARPGNVGKGIAPAHRLVWAQTSGLFILLFIRSTTGPSFETNHFNLILFLVCTIAAASLYRSRPPNTRNSPSPQPQLTPDLARRKHGLLSARPEKARLPETVRGR